MGKEERELRWPLTCGLHSHVDAMSAKDGFDS